MQILDSHEWKYIIWDSPSLENLTRELIENGPKITYMNTEVKQEEVLLSLGEQYPSAFVHKDFDYSIAKKYDLTVVRCEKTGAARLRSSPPDNELWGDYYYRSDCNPQMIGDLRSLVEDTCKKAKFKSGDLWLDIASNCGSLLEAVPDCFCKVGIDPVKGDIYEEAKKHANIIQDFFSKEAWEKSEFAGRKASVVTCCACIYDLEDPKRFLSDIKDVLADDGLLILQYTYTPLTFDTKSFGDFTFEHRTYLDLTTIYAILWDLGMVVTDSEINDVNCGSIRLYVTKSKNYDVNTIPNIIGRYRVNAVLNNEHNLYNNEDVWKNLGRSITILKNETMDFLKDCKNKNKKVLGLGAATKGNTVLQYFGITPDILPAIGETNVAKVGKFMIGSHIPIISQDEVIAQNPDYILVLVPQYLNSIKEQLKDYLKNGGKLITLFPELRISE